MGPNNHHLIDNDQLKLVPLPPSSSSSSSSFSPSPCPSSRDHASAPLRAHAPAAVLDRVARIFAGQGVGSSQYIGERLSIAEHSCQAALLARRAGEDPAVVVGALLHDIGHMLGLEAGHEPQMEGCGTLRHEEVGARFVEQLGFSPLVAFVQRQHVNAKRYRCHIEPGYEEGLSPASRTSLRHQGGPMTASEAAEAAADPHWPIALRVRGYDERAKDPAMQTPGLEAFVSELENNLLRGGGSSSPHASIYLLSSEQVRMWNAKGALTVRFVDNPASLAAIADQLPGGGAIDIIRPAAGKAAAVHVTGDRATPVPLDRGDVLLVDPKRVEEVEAVGGWIERETLRA